MIHDTTTDTCPAKCQCHAGPFLACSVPGGCGSQGCGRQRQTRGSCPCCWRRNPDPSKGEGRVCGPCERWLPIVLASIAEKTAQLPELIVPSDVPVDERWYWHWHPRRKDKGTGELLPAEGEWRPADPLSQVGGAGPTKGRRSQPKVSGGDAGAPVPVRLDVMDLLGPVVREGGRPADSLSVDSWATKVPRLERGDDVEVPLRDLRMVPVRDEDGRIVGERLEETWHTVRLQQRRPAVDACGRPVMVSAGDQAGRIPVAAVLDQEVRAWIDAGAPGSRWRPVPTVPVLADWLTNRLLWARENYGPIDEFRITINRLRGVLMATLDEFDPPPELCVGVECNRCDQRMLYRRLDGTGDVECANPSCGKILRAEDYREWVEWQGAYEESQRSPEEVADLLRPTYRRPDTPHRTPVR